jgi:ABC transport system ATP-binding/permease protein
VTEKKKLSYKEQREFDLLDHEIENLSKEKSSISEKMNSGGLPFYELQKLSNQIGELTQMLDEKELRWLELSDSLNNA